MPRHLENAYLVSCAKAVLDSPQKPILMVPVSLEIHDRIDHVLQNSRASNLPILRHVPNQNRDAAGIFRKDHQVQRALAQLSRASGRPGEFALIHCLDGVNHKDLRLYFARMFQYFFKVRLAQKQHVTPGNIQPFAAELHLACALLATHIQRLDASSIHRRKSRKHERRFANSRIAC